MNTTMSLAQYMDTALKGALDRVKQSSSPGQRGLNVMATIRTLAPKAYENGTLPEQLIEQAFSLPDEALVQSPLRLP